MATALPPRPKIVRIPTSAVAREGSASAPTSSEPESFLRRHLGVVVVAGGAVVLLAWQAIAASARETVLRDFIRSQKSSEGSK